MEITYQYVLDVKYIIKRLCTIAADLEMFASVLVVLLAIHFPGYEDITLSRSYYTKSGYIKSLFDTSICVEESKKSKVKWEALQPTLYYQQEMHTYKYSYLNSTQHDMYLHFKLKYVYNNGSIFESNWTTVLWNETVVKENAQSSFDYLNTLLNIICIVIIIVLIFILCKSFTRNTL